MCTGTLPALGRYADAVENTAQDTYSTGQAAKILRVHPRTIRKMCDRGELEGWHDEAGNWRLSQASVHAWLEDRPRGRPEEPLGASESVRELQVRVEDLAYRLGHSEAHAELTEWAESTLRDERDRLLKYLDRERQRADDERERAERLRAELEDERGKGFWRRLFGG